MDLFGIADYERVDVHMRQYGRLEQRCYRSFKQNVSMLASRWHETGLSTRLRVIRSREKSGVLSKEVSYYVSDHTPDNQAQADELFDTIRGHWVVEVMHHKRDVSLSEDNLRTRKIDVSRLVSSMSIRS